MRAFISHNKADKATARLVAQLLVGQGWDVWFDEWNLRPGDSIVGGIEEGIDGVNVFILLWSVTASNSNWVTAEYRAFLHRRMKDSSLRVIPIGIDDTPFPGLLSDYSGFVLSPNTSLDDVVRKITGIQSDVEIAKVIQAKLNHMMEKGGGGDPFPYLVCPSCAGINLTRGSASDHRTTIGWIRCSDCGWGDWIG